MGVPLLSYGPVVTANDHRVQPGLDSLAAGYVPARLPYQVHAIPHLPRSSGLGRAKEEAGFLEERLAEAQAERAGYVRLAAQGRISE